MENSDVRATTTQPRTVIGGSQDLRRYRRTAGLTQIELAERSKVSLAFIRNVEQGHVPKNSPTLARVFSLLEDVSRAANSAERPRIAGEAATSGSG